MALRRVVSFSIVFVCGIVVGGLLLDLLPRTAALTVAQRRALQQLDKPPIATPIGDNKIVLAAKRIEPAVVNIDTIGRLQQDTEGLPFPLDREVRGKGSGVILTADGYIVTNNHVIDGATRIRVTLTDGQWYYAKLVGRDPQTDLAVVRVEAANLPAAELGDSDALQVGEWSIAVGNPLGLGSSVTVGVVSALNRHNLQVDEGHVIEGAIQTDAAINRGNSGGALANINGQLIGINTAILSSGPGGGSIGLGFAIPSNAVRRTVRDLIATGSTPQKTPKKPWLDIQFGLVPPEVGQAFGLGDNRGIQIKRVLPDTPASHAGLKDGDIILSIDGKEIGDARDVSEAIAQRKIGDRALIHILRPGSDLSTSRAKPLDREHDVSVVLQARPEMVRFSP